jgi:hypothetical protein
VIYNSASTISQTALKLTRYPYSTVPGHFILTKVNAHNRNRMYSSVTTENMNKAPEMLMKKNGFYW